SWPCPPAQNEGCGLPVIKLDGLIDLSHGGLRDFAHCDLNTSGLCAHQKLQGEYIKERDVLIADRLYSGYEIIAGLRQRGAHFIGRTHQSRKIDFRKGRRIGPDERIVDPLSQARGKLAELKGQGKNENSLSRMLSHLGRTWLNGDQRKEDFPVLEQLRFSSEGADITGTAEKMESIQDLRTVADGSGYRAALGDIQQIPGGGLRFTLSLRRDLQ
ncbi:MAG TPA: hypothetical protein PLD93_03325, partial [Synergistaceae bacterium]|nr:hypothetical protein [Synergistaceae bacterium]